VKKIVLSLVAVIAVAAAGLAWFVTRTPTSPFDRQTTASATPDKIALGEQVARQADCVACHSVPGGKPFAGGLKMGTPIGAIYSTNITPDRETGIGRYTLADFDRAVRQGVALDGHRLYPAMPYPSYVKMSDADVEALYAYFTVGVAAANVPNKPVEMTFPLNQRWPLAMWNAVFSGAGPFQPDSNHDAIWNRGAYLVEAAGHCGSCHTPRGLAFNEKALDAGSSAYLSGALLDGWYAPSLRQDSNSGIGRWSETDIFQFLKTGRNIHGVVFGSMTEAFNNSTQFMSDDDLKAISHFLKSLPGDPARDGKPWHYQAAAIATGSPADRTKAAPGAQTFIAKCSFCHGLDGKGRNEWIPALAGAASSLAPVPDSQINITLNGADRVVAADIPDAYRMPAYRGQLSDQEIADVVSFVRSSWGNNGSAVSAKDVSTLRSHTDPASPTPIILQMR
jgi:mono/diheme cytochrome c family protein